MQVRVKNLVNAALIAALTAAGTMVFKLPLPMDKGYVHLGDCVILLSGFLPPAWAAAAAAAGSALSDVLLGYAVYAPVTAFIKGLMGWMAGKWIAAPMRPSRKLFGMLLAEGWMAAGYFLFENVCFGTAAALAGLGGNAVQAAGCILLAMLMHRPMTMIVKMMKTR